MISWQHNHRKSGSFISIWQNSIRIFLLHLKGGSNRWSVRRQNLTAILWRMCMIIIWKSRISARGRIKRAADPFQGSDRLPHCDIHAQMSCERWKGKRTGRNQAFIWNCKQTEGVFGGAGVYSGTGRRRKTEWFPVTEWRCAAILQRLYRERRIRWIPVTAYYLFDNSAHCYVEMQLRTKTMDDIAEIGSANHLGYEKSRSVSVQDVMLFRWENAFILMRHMKEEWNCSSLNCQSWMWICSQRLTTVWSMMAVVFTAAGWSCHMSIYRVSRMINEKWKITKICK